MKNRLIMIACGFVGLAAAYGLGAVLHQPRTIPSASSANANPGGVEFAERVVREPESVSAPKIPVEMPEIAEPTKVLLGEMKVPDALLKAPPPPERPDLIVPDIK